MCTGIFHQRSYGNGQNALNGRAICNLLEGRYELLRDDKALGARVAELMLQLPGCVKRIDIDDGQTGLEYTG
ncbi:hypothetical protein D3C86_2163020 [compost metagenome]